MVETITASCRGFVDLLESLTRSRALKPLIDFYPGFKVTADEETRGLVARLGELGVQFKDAENLTFSTLTSLELEGWTHRNLPDAA